MADETKAALTFYLWDGTVLTFSAESGPLSITVADGIVFVKQHSTETGIPTTSIRYSEELKEESSNG
jgi:hypothetical protein